MPVCGTVLCAVQPLDDFRHRLPGPWRGLMSKRNRRERQADNASGATVTGKGVQSRTRLRTLRMVTVIAAFGIVLSVLMRHSPTGGSDDPTQGRGFTQVGREGSTFTVSVPLAPVAIVW